MSDCDCVDHCTFFEERPGVFGPVEDILVEKLCRSGGVECARHVVYTIAGPHAVPPHLFPSDLKGADRILERARAS